MKAALRLLPVLFACVLFASCQKELTDPMTPVTPPVITPYDSVTLLSRFAFIDINSSPSDTTGYYDFVYDSLHRVTNIKVYDYSNNGVTSLQGEYTYHYTSNDTLAWKKTETDYDPANGYTYSYFYFYDAQQRLIKDSVFYESTGEVHNYTYSNTMITMKGRAFDPNDPSYIFDERDTGFIGNSGNITQTNSYYDTDSTKHFLAYDNHPNPFLPLNIRSTYNPVPGYNFYLEDLNLQRNNIITSNGVFNSSTVTYTYTYNTAGYPSTVNIHFEDVPQDDYNMVFFYKKY